MITLGDGWSMTTDGTMIHSGIRLDGKAAETALYVKQAKAGRLNTPPGPGTGFGKPAPPARKRPVGEGYQGDSMSPEGTEPLSDVEPGPAGETANGPMMEGELPDLSDHSDGDLVSLHRYHSSMLAHVQNEQKRRGSPRGRKRYNCSCGPQGCECRQVVLRSESGATMRFANESELARFRREHAGDSFWMKGSTVFKELS
jgi:hypothetical protein